MIAALHSIGIQNTGVFFTSIGITVILSILAILASKNMQMVPYGLQNVAEWAVGSLHNFFTGVMGEKACKQYFPLIATFFIYIMLCNYSGLLPLSGKTPFQAAPTGSFNTPAALAIIVFCATQVVGFREYHGPRYLLSFFKPVAFLAPLMIIEQFTKPLSLTLRLYGNIYGEEAVTESFFELCPIALPVVLQALSVLMGAVQALVFSLLTAVYLAEVVEAAEEDEHQRELKLVAKKQAA